MADGEEREGAPPLSGLTDVRPWLRAHVQTWEDAVAVAAEWRQRRDAYAWWLGDLALHVCTPRLRGRPRPGEEDHTIAALAAAIGENRSALSSMAANSEFFTPEERRQIPPHVSWRQCAEARRATGWKPGQPVTAGQRQKAWDYILGRADGDPGVGRPATESHRLPVRCLTASAFEAWLAERGRGAAAVVILPGEPDDWGDVREVVLKVPAGRIDPARV